MSLNYVSRARPTAGLCGYIVVPSTWLGSLPVASDLTFVLMVPFLPFLTVTLAGTVVASVGNHLGRRELRMKRDLESRADMADVDCTDTPTSTFLYHS
jgi:hypothetical protein